MVADSSGEADADACPAGDRPADEAPGGGPALVDDSVRSRAGARCREGAWCPRAAWLGCGGDRPLSAERSEEAGESASEDRASGSAWPEECSKSAEESESVFAPFSSCCSGISTSCSEVIS